MAGVLTQRSTLVAAGATLALMILLIALGFDQALVLGIVNGVLYGLVALGLVLIYKSSGIFNFAQGEFGTVSVFALYLLLSKNVPYVISLVLALGCAVAMGLAVERLVVRPLFEAPRVILLVATAGVALLSIGVEVWWGQARPRPISPLLGRLDRVSVLGVKVSDQRMLLILVLVVFAVALAYFFNRTNLGLAILGASQEPTAIELVGISVRRLSAITWGLAAFLGGVAGCIGAPISASFAPGFMTTTALIPAFAAAVLGGMTSLTGAFVGGAIVGVAQSVALQAHAFRSIPGPGSAMVFVILVGVLAVRPQGLLGKAA
jgi:branched-chain amino acid transport system permease protein